MFKHYHGKRTSSVDALHKKHGKIIRVGPNSLSFSTVAAAKDIYGQGTATSKDKFYNSLAGFHRQLLDTLDKEEHASRRKLFAAAFAKKPVEEKEYNVNADIQQPLRQWDKLVTAPPRPGQDRFDPSTLRSSSMLEMDQSPYARPRLRLRIRAQVGLRSSG